MYSPSTREISVDASRSSVCCDLRTEREFGRRSKRQSMEGNAAVVLKKICECKRLTKYNIYCHHERVWERRWRRGWRRSPENKSILKIIKLYLKEIIRTYLLNLFQKLKITGIHIKSKWFVLIEKAPVYPPPQLCCVENCVQKKSMCSYEYVSIRHNNL